MNRLVLAATERYICQPVIALVIGYRLHPLPPLPSHIPHPTSTMSVLLLLLLASLCALSHASTLEGHWQPSLPGRLPTSADHYHGEMVDPAAQGEVTVNTSWSNTAWQSSSITRPASLHSTMVLREEGETEVKAGVFVSGTMVDYNSYRFFSYKPASLNVPFDIFVGIGSCDFPGSCDIHVLMNDSPFAVSLNATYTWHYSSAIRIDSAHPLSCEFRNVPLASCQYHYTLVTYVENQEFFTTVMNPPPGIAELRSGISQSGTLDGGATAWYYVTNGVLEEIMIFALTATVGNCDLYVSTTIERPTPDNYTWSSADYGDDVIIVNGTKAGPGGRPGLYYYIGVYNTRLASSSYSIVGSGYSTSGVPLDNAWYLQADLPQQDYAMANTYRYYYLYIQGVWPTMTITLDSSRGDADIYANLGRYFYFNQNDETTMFPSRFTAQYNSTTSGLDQINITAPTSSYYLFIAVYSKGVDSRYSITVTGEGRVATLYTYGYPVTAQVAAGRSLYYVATVPNYGFSMSLYMLAFTLRSLSGNADLYISDTYMYPNATHHNWTSEQAGNGLDMAVLRGDVQSGSTTQLHAGNYYVAVRGSTASSFQLWSYLRIRQYLQVNTVLSYYHYGGVLYWEIEVPRGAEFTIVTTPLVFYGGSFNLYVGNVAEPIPSVASTYQLKTNSVMRVTPAVSPCTGSGSTCRYYVAIERVNAENETEYASFSMFVYSPNVPPTQLLPNVPLEKPTITQGGTAYQFNVSCPRSRVTITLVTSNAQSVIGSPMSINRGPLPPFSLLDNIEFGFAETTKVGLRTFTLTFDWNHPLLRGKSMVGRYMLVVMPVFISAWTLLLSVDGGSCAALPAQTTMQPLMPYTAMVNATSMTYFSYQTAPSASGYLYFTLTPQNSSTSLSGVSILARADGDVPAAGYAQFSSSTGMLRVNADACSNGASSNVSSTSCQYSLAVGSAMGSAAFIITASTSQPLYALDATATTAKLAGTVGLSSAASGTALVPRGVSSVALVTEACTGAVNVYLNYRTTAIPSSSASDVNAMTVTSPIALAAALNTVNATQLIASIVGVGAASNTFETRLFTNVAWTAASPTAASTTPTVTDYRSVPSSYARVRIPLAATPAAVTAGTIRQPTGTTGYLRYSVYMNETATNYNLRSRCGLAMSSAVLIHTAVGLTTSSNTLDIKLPTSSSGRRYTLTVLVDHVWRTTINSRNYSYEASSAGYIVYTPVEVRSGTRQPEDDSSSSSGMAPPPPATESSGLSGTTIAIISVVVFLVLLVALLVGVRYYRGKAGVDRGMQLLNGDSSYQSSLPSDTFVQAPLQQQPPSRLTGEAYYGLPPEGR